MSGHRGGTRWFATSALALVAAVYAANLLFYAGASSADGLSWRMEHGCLTIKQRPDGHEKPFWIDGTREDLRWSPEWRRAGPGDWSATVPLWVPLSLCLVWCAASWVRRATAPASAGS